VTDDEQSGARTHAQHDEALFVDRVIFIEKLDSKFIVENGSRLFEGDPMPPEIFRCFARIPIELNHKYIVFTTTIASSRLRRCSLRVEPTDHYECGVKSSEAP
jgi:hypothetical protein